MLRRILRVHPGIAEQYACPSFNLFSTQQSEWSFKNQCDRVTTLLKSSWGFPLYLEWKANSLFEFAKPSKYWLLLDSPSVSSHIPLPLSPSRRPASWAVFQFPEHAKPVPTFASFYACWTFSLPGMIITGLTGFLSFRSQLKYHPLRETSLTMGMSHLLL